jgi:hypothetical protein
MVKKVHFGSSDGYTVNDEIKTKIIDWLYTKIDLSKHRYIILNSIQRLENLQENQHYVSPNFKGYNYLLLMLTINDKQYCVAIDRKKLSYHKSQLDMKTIDVIQLHIKCSDAIFRGSIFDGKLIQNVFLIQDCFHLMGSSILNMEMLQKMQHLDTILNTNFKKNNYFDIKLNKLHTYEELENMIKNMQKLSFSTNGIIFYPPKSGITILHIEKKNDKVEIKSNNEVIEQKSYNIIVDFVDFLKSRNYSYESNSKMKRFWLTRTIIPDVYDISENKDSSKLGIALIPNLKTSHMCDEIIKDQPVQFNCVFCNKFKKWIPLNSV